jgi:hypothetical protein
MVVLSSFKSSLLRTVVSGSSGLRSGISDTPSPVATAKCELTTAPLSRDGGPSWLLQVGPSTSRSSRIDRPLQLQPAPPTFGAIGSPILQMVLWHMCKTAMRRSPKYASTGLASRTSRKSLTKFEWPSDPLSKRSRVEGPLNLLNPNVILLS